jgi:hypothetical protein
MFPHSAISKKLDGEDQKSFDLMVGTWASALREVTDDQVCTGITAVLKSGSQFIPSLPAFVRMCTGSKAAMHQPYKALPRPSGARKAAAAGVAAMKKVLRER